MAYHGRDLGIDITCVMPKTAPLTKVTKSHPKPLTQSISAPLNNNNFDISCVFFQVNNCRRYGANVILHGAHIGE
jgi:hypothetical protein